jgi:hypothetical protein
MPFMAAILRSGRFSRAMCVRHGRRLGLSRRLWKLAARARSLKQRRGSSNPRKQFTKHLLIGISGDSDQRQAPEGEYRMPLMQICITLVIVGVLLWLVNRFIPMQSSINSILNGVVVIVVVLWLLNVFGIFHLQAFSHLRMRR